MKFFSLLISAIMLCLLAGCASIFTKNHYSIAIDSNILDVSAKIRKSSNRELVWQGNLPAVVDLSASEGFFSGACYECEVTSHDGNKYLYTIDSNIDAYFWANLLLGGVGMLLDAANGSMFELPDQFKIELPEQSQTPVLRKKVPAGITGEAGNIGNGMIHSEKNTNSVTLPFRELIPGAPVPVLIK